MDKLEGFFKILLLVATILSTLGITFSNIISGLKNYKEMKEMGNNKKNDKKKEQRPKQRKRCSK
ncbi:hypothetical protein CN594_34340 [Bacillus toyonensis]|uniref:hypothetical protein n=1 Tax=Bacillus toyonensis TaxID=155322 RepID=UPI000BF18E15|nr:hypothetical protein [Bacillus toyonensis]PEK73403.1 hypothetical protein CN594_34340 [Bacillus toyonensis]